MRAIWIALDYSEQALGTDGNPACAGSRMQGGVGLGSESLPGTRFGFFMESTLPHGHCLMPRRIKRPTEISGQKHQENQMPLSPRQVKKDDCRNPEYGEQTVC